MQGNLTPFLCSLADLGSRLSLPPLRDAARDLLRLLPAEQSVISALRARLFTEGGGDGADLERFFQVPDNQYCGSMTFLVRIRIRNTAGNTVFPYKGPYHSGRSKY